jgi:hypothetical protein
MATNFNKTALANGTSNLLSRTNALNTSTDLVQTGVVFNDAVRISLGLFSGSQGSGNSNTFLSSYTTDIHAVESDIAAMLANPNAVTVGGQTFTLNSTDVSVLTNVQAQLGTLLAAAAQTTNATTMTAASQTIHSLEQEILSEVNNDAHLSSALNQVTYTATTGATDVAFQNLPAGADDPTTLAAATAGTSLKTIGEVFNEVVTLASGGINANNLAEITTDLTAVKSGLTAILNNATMLAQIEAGETANAAAATTLHLQTVLNQVNLQLTKYDTAASTGNTTALRGTADNLLDIIDIVQNDTALNKAAGGNGAAGHTGGFAEDAGGLTGTVTKFQDNQAQTNFWATFISEANTINAQLAKIVNGTGTASQTLIAQIENYQNFGASFDAAQGAIFQGRFDNELNNGTLEADSATAIKALEGILNGDTGAALASDKAALTAAGEGFVADAKDVSGNNIAVGGASYVGTATTVSTATSVHGLAQGTTKVTAHPNIANGTGGSATSSTTTSGTTTSHGGTTTSSGGTTTSSGGTTASSGGTTTSTGTTKTTGTTTTKSGSGTTTAQTSGHHHDKTSTAATHHSTASHTSSAAHSSATVDHQHVMHHLWG